MTTIEIAALVAAVALQASRLLGASKPLWYKLPDWAQGFLPVLVLALPEIASRAGLVETHMDLAELAIIAATMLLPGMHTRKTDAAKNGGGSVGPAVLLLAVGLALSANSCKPGGGIAWPKVVTDCAPAPSVLSDKVTRILFGDSGSLSERAMAELEELAATHGASTIVCLVDSLVSELTGKVGANPEETSAAARGDEFLAKVGSRVEE